MSARRSTQNVLLFSAVAAASGLLADDPIACGVAVVSGLIAFLVPLRPGRAACPATGTGRGAPPLDLRTLAVFRAFQGDDPRSASVHDAEDGSGAEPAPEPEEPVAETDAPDPAYEEFAAGLEDESAEEISFLPPYVSGDDGSEADEADTGSWEPVVVDSPLLQELNDVLDPRSRMPMPRRFALGTVAILRNLLDPEEVTRIIDEQRRYPRLRFGDIAVELGLLSVAERDELVRAQQEGVFSDEEIRDAKRRLESHYARGGRSRG